MMKKIVVRKRKSSLHATAFATEIIWSFQERSEPKVTPSIDILSRNSNELESKEMSGKFLSTRLEIKTALRFARIKADQVVRN